VFNVLYSHVGEPVEAAQARGGWAAPRAACGSASTMPR
jgi:hypothetical protein